MKILYVSAMCPHDVVDRIYRTTGRNPGFAMQKFNRLVASGLAACGAEVTTASAVPVSPSYPKRLWRLKPERADGIAYRFLPFINVSVLRQLCLAAGAFFAMLKFGMTKRAEKRVVFDVLNVSVNLGALLATRLCGVRTCGIVTDMPGLIVGEGEACRSTKAKIVARVNKSYLSKFDSFVFLTEAMNPVINRRNVPYIVMEGLVAAGSEPWRRSPSTPRSVIYAGGLEERYGLRMLVDAFRRLDLADTRLDLYGSGSMTDELRAIAAADSRIAYHGVRPNSEIVEAERAATLLVNPRPTTEEFTLYSFPSKNMEYMLSGTPVLTTALPGMPAEYHHHVYLFDEETTAGYARRLREVLSLPGEELAGRGHRAREFVLGKKNNVAQSRRILSLLQKI